MANRKHNIPKWEKKILQEAAMKAEVDLKQALTAKKSLHIIAARRKLVEQLRLEGYSLQAIADLLGYKDHTTVYYLLEPRRKCAG